MPPSTNISTKIMNKHFDYSQREQEIYAQWESSGAFRSSGQGTPYFIPMPPPNITGQLHTGHALGTTLQDILIRYHRMRGDDTLFLPGYDHAGLGAQTKILEAMAQAGIENPTQEQFNEFAAEWTDSTRERITEQLKRLGASADWEQARYTLDEYYQEATAEAFKRLYKAGLIYYNHDDDQWYLKLSELAKPFIKALDDGELKIYPAEAEARLRQTPDGQPLEQAHDWCISRQIMWGHQIPMWGYRNRQTGQTFWSPNQINHIAAATTLGGSAGDWEIGLSPDRLDTWFSSSLWIFAALGWPNQTPDFDRYFPAATLETGWDIMFFWAARMSMMSLALTGQLPFKELYLHGLIRDAKGQKMSKSLGNGTDPLEQAAEYGTDALRWALAAYQEPGRDRALGSDQLDTGRRLANKLWNIGKFIHNDDWYWNEGGIYTDDIREARYPRTGDDLTEWDDALLELEETKHLYHEAIARKDFPAAAQALRSFIYDHISGQLIPAAKGSPGPLTTATLRYIYAETLKMSHPFIPFITEELWDHLGTGRGLLINQQFTRQCLTQDEEDAIISEIINRDIEAFAASIGGDQPNPWELPSALSDTGDEAPLTSLEHLAEAIEATGDKDWLEELWVKTIQSPIPAHRKLELAIEQFGIEDLALDIKDEFGIEFDLTPPAISAEYEDENDPTDFRLHPNYSYAYVAVAPPNGDRSQDITVTIKREDEGVVVDLHSHHDIASLASTWATWGDASDE